MNPVYKKILDILDVFTLILHQFVEGKKVDNEFEKERLRVWKNDMKHKLFVDEDWPERFEEDWE